MTAVDLGGAVDRAVEQAMAADPTVLVMGEDVPMLRSGLFARFGAGRVRATPISEAAFLGAGVGAALGGLRPVVEIMFVDFLSVALHALANEAAMVAPLSGGRWRVPLLVRAACGGGYGDAGQHEQALWGLLSSIPGIVVAVPATPADAAGLTLTALGHDGPVVLLEHKLLSEQWRTTVAGSAAARATLDVPEATPGTGLPAAGPLRPVPFGAAALHRPAPAEPGVGALVVTVGMGVHRSLAAARLLAADRVALTVLDVRTPAPLDRETILAEAARASAVLVVDEDHGPFGLCAEVLAELAMAGVRVPCGRLAPQEVLPYARPLEAAVLPTPERIADGVRGLLGRTGGQGQPAPGQG